MAVDKVHKVMHEFKHGELHSGSKHGPMVTKRSQAVAIALDEARRYGQRVAPRKRRRGSPAYQALGE